MSQSLPPSQDGWVARTAERWGVTRDAQRALALPLQPLAWATFLSVTLVAGWVQTWPLAWQYVPFVVSIVLFGLPHGAVDHLAVLRVAGVRPTWGRVGVVCAVYLVGVGLFLGLWFLSPVAAAVCFIGMTWLHWGQGDVFTLTTAPARTHLQARWARVAALVMRGSLPMLVPLLAFAGDYAAVAASFVALFDPAGAERLGAALIALDPRPLWVAYGAAVGLYAVATAWQARHAAAWQAWGIDLAEVALLVVFFARVPPVLSVGLYFCLWHAVRHLARLVPLGAPRRAGSERLSRPSLSAALRQLALEATPLTLGALALLGGLYALVPEPPSTLAGNVALYLVLISALTFPHVLVVCWMDRHQHIWAAPDASDARITFPPPVAQP